MKRFVYTLSIIILWGHTGFAMLYAPPVACPSPVQIQSKPVTRIDFNTNVLLSKDGIRKIKLNNHEEISIFIDERDFPRHCKEKVPTFPLNAALTMKNMTMLKEFYSNWHGGIHGVVEFKQSIAATLCKLAQLPHDPKTDIVPFLLKHLDPFSIERIDCLLEAALDNGHLAIIEYCRHHFHAAYIALALHDACKNNNEKHVTNLLKANISPEFGLGKQEVAQLILHDDVGFETELSPYAHYPLHHAISLNHDIIVKILLNYKANPQRLSHRKLTPLNTALRSFNENDAPLVVARRLSIIEALFQALPEHGRPLPVELNLIFVPGEFRRNIIDIAQKYAPQPPQRLSMEDSFSKEYTQEEFEKFQNKVNLAAALCAPFCIAGGIYAASLCKPTKKASSTAQPKVTPIPHQKIKKSNGAVYNRKK